MRYLRQKCAANSIRMHIPNILSVCYGNSLALYSAAQVANMQNVVSHLVAAGHVEVNESFRSLSGREVTETAVGDLRAVRETQVLQVIQFSAKGNDHKSSIHFK